MLTVTMFSMAPSVYTTDTSAEAEAVQLDLLRKMTPQQRIEKMCGLSHSVRQMTLQAIRRRHPEYSDADVQLKFIELTYGQALADDLRRWQETLS